MLDKIHVDPVCSVGFQKIYFQQIVLINDKVWTQKGRVRDFNIKQESAKNAEFVFGKIQQNIFVWNFRS